MYVSPFLSFIFASIVTNKIHQNWLSGLRVKTFVQFYCEDRFDVVKHSSIVQVWYPDSKNICVHEHVCLYCLDVFCVYACLKTIVYAYVYLYIYCVFCVFIFTQQKYISMYIYPLSRIHNTSLTRLSLDYFSLLDIWVIT
jgi:hypothetical protein